MGNVERISASSEYDNHYAGIKAIQGKCLAWSSQYQYKSDFTPQWIQIKLKKPRKVTQISFQGTV